MKRRNHLFNVIALTSVFILNVSLLINLNRSATGLNSYDTTSLPNEIDLNDNTEQQIRTYYSSLNSLDVSRRQGTNLLIELKGILKNNQQYLSYDSTNGSIWDVYCIVDRDWNKSPATALPAAAGTYNTQTNKITNYHWGGNSDRYENPYLHALYYNRENEPVARAYGDHGNSVNNPTGINREHIWPKGAGFDTKAQGGARGDIMHLWAAHGHTNNKHSNLYYGYVDQDRSFEDEATDTVECAGNLSGYSRTLGGTTKVFEPQDCDKGDIARACFYMAARYNNLAGNDNNIDSNNPNLELVNDLTSWKSKGYTSTTTTTGKLGILQDLLEWNRLDPPDEFEIHRNNLCYNNFTKNRNPFVDFPSWADAIWGTVDANGNYNQTPVGNATPSTDLINTFGTSDVFAISTSSLNLQVNDTAQIYARNASTNISWSVSDGSVIGLNKTSTQNNEPVTITALSGGNATITATSGSDNLTCSVTVSSVNYGTVTNPLSVDEAISVISLTGTSETPQPLCVKGIVSSASYSDQYQNFNYIWLKSDDGLTEQALELYHTELDEAYVNDYSDDTSLVGKEIVARGYAKHYNSSIYELCTSSRNPNRPMILSVSEPAGPNIDAYLENTAPYVDLLATENDTRETDSTTYNFGTSGLDNGVDIEDLSIGAGVTIDGDVGSNGSGNTPKYYDNSGKGEMRVYKGNTFTLTCANHMTRVTITYSGDSYSSGLTANVGTLSNGVWTGSATSITFTNSNQTNTQIRFRTIAVTTSEGEYSLSGVALRFGIIFPKADWTSINGVRPISDYGVMIVKKDTLNDTYDDDTIEEAHDDGDYLLDIHRGSYIEPWSKDENNYAFTVKLSMTLEESYEITYCAAPYIIAGGRYYFLDQIETSVNDLADYYLDNGGSSLSTDALTLLSTTH